MIKYSLHRYVEVEDQDVCVVYNLTFDNDKYGLECYKPGADFTRSLNYCKINDVTSDPEFAEVLLEKLAQSNVMPVHIHDIIEDYYPFEFSH